MKYKNAWVDEDNDLIAARENIAESASINGRFIFLSTKLLEFLKNSTSRNAPGKTNDTFASGQFTRLKSPYSGALSIAFSIVIASFQLLARKNTHAILTKLKVIPQARMRGKVKACKRQNR